MPLQLCNQFWQSLRKVQGEAWSVSIAIAIVTSPFYLFKFWSFSHRSASVAIAIATFDSCRSFSHRSEYSVSSPCHLFRFWSLPVILTQECECSNSYHHLSLPPLQILVHASHSPNATVLTKQSCQTSHVDFTEIVTLAFSWMLFEIYAT